MAAVCSACLCPASSACWPLLGSGALLGGAYYFQYVMGLPPCDMCYWQRYPHMVAIAAGLRRPRLLRAGRGSRSCWC